MLPAVGDSHFALLQGVSTCEAELCVYVCVCVCVCVRTHACVCMHMHVECAHAIPRVYLCWNFKEVVVLSLQSVVHLVLLVLCVCSGAFTHSLSTALMAVVLHCMGSYRAALLHS